MNIRFKKLSKEAITPRRGSDYAAGLDLHALLEADELLVPAGATVKIKTGIAMEIPNGYFGGVFARSGLATKKGLRPSNCVGVIDSDYRGEIIVAIHNDSEFDNIIYNGDRIAQLVIIPCFMASLEEVDCLTNTVRGGNGFGSTGEKGAA